MLKTPAILLATWMAFSAIKNGRPALAAPLSSNSASLPLTVATAADTPHLSALAKMPVREITVFKDGHAFVLHEGAMPVDGTGNVLLDYLPVPVIGTFWPYSANTNVKLRGVVASPRRLIVDRTALNIRELLEANIGAEVVITDYNNTKYAAQILAVPARSSTELDATGPAPTVNPADASSVPVTTGQTLPQPGNIILLKAADGVRVLPVERIQDVTFKNTPKAQLGNEEFRNLLTLQLDWGRQKPQRTTPVGMVYLQKGMRWIPGYRVTLDGKGRAVVKLQATLLNELTDLEDVTANLVIGVPSFAFKDTLDPISLQQTMARLSSYFEQDARTAYGFSNAVMTQSARAGEYSVADSTTPARNLGPEVADTNHNEDLFIFTLKHVTLKKGERMVVPVAEYQLPYKDVYTLDLPIAPPADIYRNLNSNQQSELARLLSAPKVMHKVRLTDKSNQPLTTAPALIERDGRLLGQGMLTYTAVGSDTDLEITAALDIITTKTETETKRTPDAVKWQGDAYARVDLVGKIHLCSYKNEPLDVEVTRQLMGEIDSADHGGTISKLNVLDDNATSRPGGYPAWWNWYSSGNAWWEHLNGIGSITWKVHLEPKKEVDLGYTYHYFWR
ncbi:MAG: hypothetical protein JO316_00390 [Abitibacteriaceae bacterium]|nr:hypothetical protein [Abditibacteriaceae bacterium]MBV9863784.1 hypothetical protein [Abditibacteriaceae bacterium]